MTDKKFDDKGMIRVFTYGTLKLGHGNHRLFQEANARFLGYDSITGPFNMIDMIGFPGVYRPEKPPEALRKVKGEVWALEPEGLASVDMLEGHPNFYRREKLWTDSQLRAWMFILNPTFLSRRPDFIEGVKSIEDGLWQPSELETEHWAAA